MKKILLILIALPFFYNTSSSQELKADVVVNMEQLDAEARINVATMEQDLENYINSNTFTDVDWQGPPIPINIQIVLSGGYNGNYSGRIFVISKRFIYGQDGGTSPTMKIADGDWSFEYSQGAFFSYNPNQFNNFISLIDYYMLIAIGMDLDTYETLGGGEVYQIAKRIVNNGASAGAPGYETFVEPGEFTKYSLVNELTDLRYEPLRILFFEYYVDGLDYMTDNEEEAKKNLRNVIADIATFKRDKMVGPSVLLQAFFDSKAEELETIFKGYEDESVFKDLMYIDPSNTVIYERAME